MGAICVERCPVITVQKTKIEKEYSDLMNSIEFENSKLSDHELRKIREEAMLSQQQKEEEEDRGAAEETQTALDLEDKWEAELKTFIPAPRRTSADEANDMQSTSRCLDTSLYLLVRQKIEGKDHWVMPQTEWEKGESIRQTAERALNSHCGEIKCTVLGNAPAAVAKFDLPKPRNQDSAKLFFYKAWYREGDVKLQDGAASDYKWVTKQELPKFCFAAYHKQIKKFLL